MSDLLVEAGKLSGKLLARRQKYLDALIEGYESDLERFAELIPQLRAESWERLTARREEVDGELTEIHDGIQGTKELIAHAQAALASARSAGDSKGAGEALAEIEGLNSRLADLNKRQGVLQAEDRDELGATSTWTGTKKELREALLSPSLLLDRLWAELQLRGPWRELASDEELGVKFRLEDGLAADFWPRPRR